VTEGRSVRYDFLDCGGKAISDDTAFSRDSTITESGVAADRFATAVQDVVGLQ